MELQIDNILQDEEIFWRQRSRIAWLKEGDRNTKFFHARASTRKRKNEIKCLTNEAGVWTEDEEEIESIDCSYFIELFSSTAPSIEHIDTTLKKVSNKITDEMRAEMVQPFTSEEVLAALLQMNPTKAPGPDRFPAAFYQTILSEDMNACTR